MAAVIVYCFCVCICSLINDIKQKMVTGGSGGEEDFCTRKGW